MATRARCPSLGSNVSLPSAASRAASPVAQAISVTAEDCAVLHSCITRLETDGWLAADALKLHTAWFTSPCVYFSFVRGLSVNRAPRTVNVWARYVWWGKGRFARSPPSIARVT